MRHAGTYRADVRVEGAITFGMNAVIVQGIECGLRVGQTGTASYRFDRAPRMHKLPAWQLFAICVLTWGTTWHAITYQLGVASPEFGVALRFGLAGACVLGWCAWRGERLRFSAGAHAWLALQGVFLYGVSYICVYHAERHLPSGLVAVGYSASPLMAGVGAMCLFGTTLSGRFVVGGLLGLAGVALIFWPEFGKTHEGDGSTGRALTVGSVLLSTVGSLVASRNRERGLPMWPCLGYGMLYGAAVSLAVVVFSGQPLAWPTAVSWCVALPYLALAGSVLTFACYLTLLDRLGAGPAGTIGVMTPLLALVVSMAFENYTPDALTGVGVLLAIAGNVLMLSRHAVKAAVRPGRPGFAGTRTTPNTPISATGREMRAFPGRSPMPTNRFASDPCCAGCRTTFDHARCTRSAVWLFRSLPPAWPGG